MLSVSEMPKIVVARVTKIARVNERCGRCGGMNIGGGYIGGGNEGGMGGIIPGGGGIPGGEPPAGPPGAAFICHDGADVGGPGGGANAPRGSIGPCPGGGCGVIKWFLPFNPTGVP